MKSLTNLEAQFHIGVEGCGSVALVRIPDTRNLQATRDRRKTEKLRKFSMTVPDRIRKYRTQGGAAGFVRVEVLAPPSERDRVRAYARQLRENRRAAEEELEAMCRDAIARFGVRALDNIDPDRLPTAQQRARVIGWALMDKGGLAGFKLGRRLVKQAEAVDSAPDEDHAHAGAKPF